MSETKFEVGDTVSWMGAEGVVKEIYDGSVKVIFTPMCYIQLFFIDGRLHQFHTEPSLKLIRKAKKKITVECWVNVYGDGIYRFYETKDQAINNAVKSYGDVTTVHLSKEVEI